MADDLVHRSHGNVDVQVGGPGNNWVYLSACGRLSGPTVPRGGTEIRWCQDPHRAGGFKVSSKIKMAPDQVTGDLMTKLGKIDYLEDLGCPFGLRARYAKCNEREDPANYDPFMLNYCPVDLTEHNYEDLAVTDPGENDEIVVTAPWTASSEYRVKKINASRVGTAAQLGDVAINDIEYCDQVTCGGYCGDRSDGCALMWGVTDANTAPYANPQLIKGIKDMPSGGITFSYAPILGLNGDVEGIECAGSRLIVSSNADSAIAYNDHKGDQNEWNVIPIAPMAPTANHNALYARTAREIWLGAENGYIYKSVNGGLTWTPVLQGEITGQNVNAVYAYDKDLVYAVCNAGIMLKSEDGGGTWDDITEIATTGADLLVVTVPPDRPKEVYIGTNAGQIFKSEDEGDTFANVPFDGDGIGSVDDIEWCGPCAGDIMWFLHNDAGPRGRILRDLSGGAGGADVEVVMDYTNVLPNSVELNALDCCGVNEAIAAGELYGTYPAVIKAS